MDRHNPPSQPTPSSSSSSAPPRRSFSYASVASRAAQPSPRLSNTINDDNAHSYIRGPIPGSSQQLPDPLRTNYLYYETHMDRVAQSAAAAAASTATADTDTVANLTTSTRSGADSAGGAARRDSGQQLLNTFLRSQYRQQPVDQYHQHHHHHHHYHTQPSNHNQTTAAPTSSSPPTATTTTTTNTTTTAAALNSEHPSPAFCPPFPMYSRKYAEATDYKIAMTAGLPPNKNAFFFVPSYMRKSLYADQLREEQRAKFGYGSWAPRGTSGINIGGDGVSGGAANSASAAPNATVTAGTTMGGMANAASQGGGGDRSRIISSIPSSTKPSSSLTAPRKLEQLSGDMPESVTNNPDRMYAIVRVVPEVKHPVAPLPTRWVLDMELKDYEVVGDGLEVRYLAADGRHQEGCSVRADHPMTHMCGVYYFEIEIVRKTKEAMVCIGLSTADVSATRLPGHDVHSWGYHGDDGRVFPGPQGTTHEQFGPKFGEGDVVGCGFDWKQGKMFFTKNGEFLGHASEEIDATLDLYPTVGLRKRPQVRVRGNFGQFPFKFDIDEYTAQIKRDTLAAVDDFDMNGEEEKISMALVAQYLIREGFTGTAAAFEKDIREEAAARDGTAPRPSRPKPMSPETRTRATIRDLIMNGRIDPAVRLVNQHFPHAIDADLEFKIRCQKFIELLRRARVNDAQHTGLTSNGNVFNNNGQSSSSSRPTSRMDVDNDTDNSEDVNMDVDNEISASDAEDAELEHALENPPENGSTAQTDENGNHIYTYSDAVQYGSKLEKLYSDVSTVEGKECRRKLDELICLLAYPDPRNSPNGYLLDERHLAALADQVSAACLKASGGKQFTALEKLFQQTEVMLQDAQKYGGLGSIINLREDFLPH